MDQSNRKSSSDNSFLFKMGSSRDIKRLSLTLTWKSEPLVAKIYQWIQNDHKKAYGLLLLQTFWTSTFSQLKVKHPSIHQP